MNETTEIKEYIKNSNIEYSFQKFPKDKFMLAIFYFSP